MTITPQTKVTQIELDRARGGDALPFAVYQRHDDGLAVFVKDFTRWEDARDCAQNEADTFKVPVLDTTTTDLVREVG